WTNPTNGTAGVPSNLPIGVHFTKPMRPYYSVGEETVGSGTGGSRLSFSPDGLEAVLTPVSGNTANALHIVTFNPMDGGLGFGDLNGNPLAADTVVVSFTDGNFTKTPSRPWLTNSAWHPNGTFQVELKGEADFSYVLESSTKLPGWAPLATNIAFGGTARFTDTNGVADELRLYRGRIK
ncbi:MAG TPA: Ig-like domain-containing protein, partial [Methylomirabilota bacterium]|nr:Ig-like domain-containing protein [Methylomirabilota bacterium]